MGLNARMMIEEPVRGRLCREFADSRLADGCKASTARRELKTLQAAINHWHRESPLEAVPRVTLPPDGPPRQVFNRSSRRKAPASELKEQYMDLEIEGAAAPATDTPPPVADTATQAPLPAQDAESSEAAGPTVDDTLAKFLERSEVARMLQVCRKRKLKHVARFILIGIYTGTRRSAALGLQWNVSLSGGYIDIDRGIVYRKGSADRETSKRRPPVAAPRRLLAFLKLWRRADTLLGFSPVIIAWIVGWIIRTLP
jgi:integrase